MSTVDKAEHRVLVSELELAQVRVRVDRALGDTKNQMSQALRERLMGELEVARGNLHHARIARNAVRRFPPLRIA